MSPALVGLFWIDLSYQVQVFFHSRGFLLKSPALATNHLPLATKICYTNQTGSHKASG